MDGANTTAGFADFEFDLGTRELRRDGERIRLQHQPSLVLSLLLSKPGRLVTRDELCRTIWKGRTVEFDTGLNFSVRQVRRALGDNAESPVFIETIPRQGYRFIADVTFAADEETELGPARLLNWRTGLVLGVAVALLTATAVLFSGRSRSPSTGSGHVKIAVLPLRVLNDKQSLDPFAQGLTEDLITDLARAGSERLRVIAYSSTRQIGKQQSDLATLRSRLGADYVVRGTIRAAGARQRITIRLEDTRDGSLTWARRFDGRRGDGLTAEADTIVAGIIRGLPIGGLDPPGTSRADALPAAARESLLRARWFLNRQTRDDSERALAELDSIRTTFNKNARVWALTAEARTSLGRYETAEAAAREAMRLDAELSDGPYQLGQALAATSRFDEALEAFEQAVELAPGVARYRQALAHQLWRQKRRQEAVEHMEVARELDPLSIDLEVDLGYLFIEVNRLPEAVQHCERSLVLLPENRWGQLCLLKAHYLLGDLAAALAQAQEVLRLQGATPRALGALDQADPRIGMLTLFDQTLQNSDDRQGNSASPDLARTLRSLLADTHSALQDRARRVAAVGTMDRPQEPEPKWPAYERWLNYIWGDPRFERLLRREDWAIPWAPDSSS